MERDTVMSATDRWSNPRREHMTSETTDAKSLYGRYATSLHAMALRRVRDPQVALDLVQDTFARLLVHPYDPSQGIDPLTYLAMILHGRISNYWRDQRGRTGEGPLDDEPTGSSQPMLFPDPADQWNLRHDLEVAIGSLSPEWRRLAELYYRDERTVREVARLMGWTRSRVAVAIKRVTRVLRAKLAAYRSS
jgi:RNA polymerase sigma-70 factor (ECF subfamily)